MVENQAPTIKVSTDTLMPKKSSFKKVGEFKPPKQVTVNIQSSAQEPPAQEHKPKSPNAAAMTAKDDKKKEEKKPMTAEEKRA